MNLTCGIVIKLNITGYELIFIFFTNSSVNIHKILIYELMVE